MDLIENKIPFGDNVCFTKECCDRGKGLKIVKPEDGDYVVYSSIDGYKTSRDFIESNGIISKKAKNREYKVYFIYRLPVKYRKFVDKEGYDHDNSKTLESFKIPYEIDLKVCFYGEKRFVEFIQGLNKRSYVSKDNLYDGVKMYIESAIREIIGRYNLKGSTALMMEANASEVAEEIKDFLNSKNGKLCDFGLCVDNFVFAINEEYEYSEQKKAKQRMEFLYSGSSKRSE